MITKWISLIPNVLEQCGRIQMLSSQWGIQNKFYCSERIWQPHFTVQVRALLEHPEIDVNRRNNDRLTSFMLAMQGGPLGMAARMGHQVRKC